MGIQGQRFRGKQEVGTDSTGSVSPHQIATFQSQPSQPPAHNPIFLLTQDLHSCFGNHEGTTALDPVIRIS